MWHLGAKVRKTLPCSLICSKDFSNPEQHSDNDLRSASRPQWLDWCVVVPNLRYDDDKASSKNPISIIHETAVWHLKFQDDIWYKKNTVVLRVLQWEDDRWSLFDIHFVWEILTVFLCRFHYINCTEKNRQFHQSNRWFDIWQPVRVCVSSIAGMSLCNIPAAFLQQLQTATDLHIHKPSSSSPLPPSLPPSVTTPVCSSWPMHWPTFAVWHTYISHTLFFSQVYHILCCYS